MICKGSILAALLVPIVLAGCSTAEPPLSPSEQAQAALARGDGEGAEKILRAMLRDGSPDDELAVAMGEAELLQGDLAAARSWLAPGRFASDSAARGFHMLGRLDLLEGNLPAAGAAFDKALALAPSDPELWPELWVDIARLRYRGGEQVQAVEAADRAVRLGPENPAALLLKGQTLRDSRGPAAALPWFARAVEVAPENPDALAEFAATLGDLGQARRMLAAVRRLEQASPGDPRALYLQAVLAARAGKRGLARALLQRSGEIERGTPAAMMLSAVLDIGNGNPASAARILERLLARQPENPRAAQLLARAYSFSGTESELVGRWSAAAARPNASPYLQTLLARAHERSGDRDAAADLLDAAARQRQPSAMVLKADGAATGSGNAVRAAIRRGIADARTDEAIRIAERFSRSHGGSADALALAGDAHLAAGDADTALLRYSAAAQVRRPWALTQRMMLALRSTGRNDDLAALLDDHARGDPDNPQAAALHAELLLSRGHADEAAMLLDWLLASAAAGSPDLLVQRARLSLAQGDREEAQGFARLAFAAQPLNPGANAVLAQALTGEEAASLSKLLQARAAR